MRSCIKASKESYLDDQNNTFDNCKISIIIKDQKMLLKWEAVILNHIYETSLFDKIIIKSSSVEEIDYGLPLEIYKNVTKNESLAIPVPWLKANEFISCAHLLCRSRDLEEKKKNILMLDKLAAEITEKAEVGSREMEREREDKIMFGLFHVILFSCLSKCSIWPSMFKTSKTLVPSLIEFYNSFFNNFTKYLDYKFDPLILSTKYSKLVKQIKQKRLAHPQLFEAVQTSNIPKLTQLVKQGESNLINECMKNGLNVSHIAAVHSNIDTLRVLNQMGANFELLDQEEQTALFYAVKRQDLGVIRFLVEEVKVSINHMEYQNRTPIYLAAFEGNLEIVEYLHSQGGNPEIESKLSRTPLSKACYLGNVGVADYLIQLGVNIEAVDSKGRTALHNAAWGRAGGRQGKRRGHIKLEDSPECAELLLKAGHKIDFQDHDKFTPLFSSISSDAEKSLRVLIKYGANLNHKTAKDESAVFIACKYGHLNILRILIQEYNCNFEQKTIQGYTPIMAALTQETNECIKYMLSLFFKRNMEIRLDKTILECLIEFGQWKNLMYLIQWISDEQKETLQREKGKFIASAIDSSIEEILQFTFQLRNEEYIALMLQIIHQLQSYLSKTSMRTLLNQIEKHKIFNDTVIKILLSEHSKGLVLPCIPLTDSITEDMLVRLLQVDSNLTETPLAVYHAFIEIVKMRLSKVILFILTTADSKQLVAEGIGKYTKRQVFGIIFGKMSEKISVLDYCLVNGYYDMYKLLCSFYNQNYEVADIELQDRPAIPHYRYKIVELKQARKCFLMPLKDLKSLLDFDHLTTSLLSKNELELYFQVKNNIKTLLVDHTMVRTSSELEQMRNYLSERRLIGIDIEHYSASNQSFICLIQIATMEKVFIIDKFNRIDGEVEQFLRELFGDESKVKIFHSYDNDLKWLCQDYQIDEFHSVLDTSRIYSLMEGQKANTPSLKWLAAEFLGLEIKKEYQRSDWRIRPLFIQMAEYAATDAKVLPFLLLSMLLRMNIDTKKGHCVQVIKSMQSKRMLRTSHRKGEVQLI